MTLFLDGQENHVDNDATMKVYVQNLLHLDCLNDSTVCFIPANHQSMDFLLSYSKYLDLTPQSDLIFHIRDKRGRFVYEEKLIIPEPDPEYPGLFYFVNIYWDGRCNIDDFKGHLANPEGSPYEAYVSINMIAADVLTSNIESFDVVPAIDSIIITHHPWYPPPDFLLNPEVHLSSIIVGKIDDQDPSQDYRYYLYNTVYIPPERNHRWDGIHYLYTDGAQPVYDFYENLQAANFDNFPRRRWQVAEWGNLRYEWWNIYDVREDTVGMLIDYSEKRDTTNYWGDDWEVCIEVPDDEENRKRLLIFNIIEHYKNDFLVQACTSAINSKAHKVIFGPTEDTYGRDNIYWSSSHIGVPYGYGAKTGYQNIDCSGFCIATQIQENDGPLISGGHIIDLDCTSADMLVRDCKPGVHTTIPVADSLTQRGDLVGIDNDLSNGWQHIANAAHIEYDNEEDEYMLLYIYEAKGYRSGDTPPLSQVRLVDYVLFYIDESDSWEIKTARWDY